MRKIVVLGLLMVFTISVAQNYSKEELAIKKAIEKETELFYQGDYDGWSSMWEHSDPVYFGVYSSDFKMEFTNWEALSKSAKEHMTMMADNKVPLPKKKDYNFYINKNSALVTFREDGDLSSRLLIKDKGSWKMKQMTVSKEKHYANLECKKLLQKLCGNWHIDASSYKTDLDWEVTLEELNGVISESEGVFNMKFEFLVQENGELARYCSEVKIGGGSLADDIPVLINNVGNNYYKAYGGKCRIADGQLHMETFPILKPERIDAKSIMRLEKDGSLYCEDKYYDKDGKPSGTMSYKLIRNL